MTSSNTTTDGSGQASLTAVVLTSIFVATVTIATVVGNSLVIFCVFYYQRLRGRTNYLIVSLAVADWLVGVLSNPFKMLQTINYNHWPTELGDTGCHFWIWVDMLCSAASIVSLMAISIDRLIAIVDPLKYEGRMRKRHIYMMICGTWVFALTCACLSLVKWKNEPVIRSYKMCSIKSEEYITFVASVAFFVPLVVVLVNYGLIFRVAIRHAKHLDKEHVSLAANYHRDNSSTDTNHNEDDANLSSPTKVSFLKRPFFKFGRQKYQEKNRHAKLSIIKQLKATKTLAVVVGVFCVCWLPFFIIFLTFQYCPECFKEPRINKHFMKVLIIIFVTVLPVANSAANPIIYTCFNKEFRRAFKRIVWKVLKIKKQGSMFTSSQCPQTTQDSIHDETRYEEK